MVESALLGVGVCAASALVAVLLGLLLSRGLERLFRVGRRRTSPSDEPEAPTDEAGEPAEAPAAEDAATETQTA